MSFDYDTPPEEPESVSPCCGSDYEELEILGELVFKCYQCNDLFDEPELDYEYSDRMREAHLEDRMDEERLGL